MHLIFFLALILIIVFARGSSKASQTASDARVEQSIKSEKDWILRNKLDPRADGYDVMAYVKNPNNRDAILEKTKKCYDSIFSRIPFREICPPQKWPNPHVTESMAEQSFRLNHRRAALILCARQGYAYEVGRYPIGSYPNGPSELDKEVMKWCCDELKRQGKDIRIIAVAMRADINRGTYYPPDWKWSPCGRVLEFADKVEEVR